MSGVSSTSVTVLDSEFRNNFGGPALSSVFQPHTEIRRNVFVENSSSSQAAAIVVGTEDGQAILEGNVFARNVALGKQVGTIRWGAPGEIVGNTIYGHQGQGGYGALLDISYYTATTVRDNVFAGNVGEAAYYAAFNTPESSCNLFWNNPDGDFYNYVPDSTDLFLDPQFCDSTSGDFTLQSSSPCLPAGPGGCGLIGALDQGCGAVSVDSESWGRIKDRYR